MIVDSSAIVAMVRREPDAPRYFDRLYGAANTKISAANYLESGIVIDGARNPVSSRRLDELLRSLSVGVVAVTESHARTARDAYRQYGKGSGHPAQLNFGDCFAFALAVESGEPLLYKGDDFGHTGIRSALDQ